MKKYLAILVLAFLLFGCTGGGGQPPQQQPPAQPPSTNQTPPVTPPPKPSPFPMKIVYEMVQGTMQGGILVNQTIEITYWLEDEKNCSARASVLGLATMQGVGGGGQPYAKVTVYLDNGDVVASNWQQESDLSFDTAKPQAADIDFLLLMNYIFNSAGKNFMNDPIWNSTEPIILKEVNVFGSESNISITKLSESTSGVVPCTEFSVVVRGTTSSEQLIACVARITDTNPLPYIVYLKPKGGEGGPNWKLKSVGKVKTLTQQEWNTCNQQGGSVESIRDSNNCITEYKCMSLKERAEMQIKNSQGPDCQVSQQIVDALATCWEQQKNADFERGNQGCVTAVRCP
ncbi:hypothetical protein H0N98_02130 [Candidatus Micrarchaeota archaeon]|nr:hypothetical protein [Candidatus Micrarchaeota archaeon]